MRQISRADERARLLMSTPGVGALVALTYVSAIDDPGALHRRPNRSGAHFGLTPKKYQSGETDVTGRITKIGEGRCRTALYEAANIILTRPVKGRALKSWAMQRCQPRRHEESQGGARPQTGRRPASHVADGTAFDATLAAARAQRHERA